MSFSVYDMIWAIINFLILLAILNKFLFKPMLKMLDERKDEIKHDLDSAARANEAAQETKEEYFLQMQQAKVDARGIIAEATRAGEESREGLLKQAQEETTRMTEKAREIIRLEKEEALRQLRDEVASLVVLAAGKVIDKTIDEKIHKELIREFIAEAGDAS